MVTKRSVGPESEATPTTEENYYGRYGDNLRDSLDQLASFSVVRYSVELSVAEAKKSFVVDGLELSDWKGLLRLQVPRGESYGALFFNASLPADVLVDFSFMFPPDSAHDMNFWFPCKSKSLATLQERTLYMGSLCGWGGRLSGVEMSFPRGDPRPAQKITTAAVLPEPGRMRYVTWAKIGDTHYLIVDGQTYLFGQIPDPVSKEPGFFALEAFAGAVLLGGFAIRTMPETSG